MPTSDVGPALLYMVSEAESIFLLLLHDPGDEEEAAEGAAGPEDEEADTAEGEEAVVDIVFSPPERALTLGGVILCSAFICFFSSRVVVEW